MYIGQFKLKELDPKSNSIYENKWFCVSVKGYLHKDGNYYNEAISTSPSDLGGYFDTLQEIVELLQKQNAQT